MRRGGKGSTPIPAALANSHLLLFLLLLSAPVTALSLPTTAEAREGAGGRVGEVVEGGVAVLPVVRERRRYATPSPADDTLVHYILDSWDANANKDGGSALVGSVGGDGRGRFYGREEENNNGNGGGGGGAGGAWWEV